MELIRASWLVGTRRLLCFVAACCNNGDAGRRAGKTCIYFSKRSDWKPASNGRLSVAQEVSPSFSSASNPQTVCHNHAFNGRDLSRATIPGAVVCYTPDTSTGLQTTCCTDYRLKKLPHPIRGHSGEKRSMEP